MPWPRQRLNLSGLNLSGFNLIGLKSGLNLSGLLLRQACSLAWFAFLVLSSQPQTSVPIAKCWKQQHIVCIVCVVFVWDSSTLQRAIAYVHIETFKNRIHLIKAYIKKKLTHVLTPSRVISCSPLSGPGPAVPAGQLIALSFLLCLSLDFGMARTRWCRMGSRPGWSSVRHVNGLRVSFILILFVSRRQAGQMQLGLQNSLIKAWNFVTESFSLVNLTSRLLSLQEECIQGCQVGKARQSYY